MKPSYFLASFAAALLLSQAPASAQPQNTPPERPNPRRMGPGPAGPQGPMGGMMQRRQALKESLGLTDVQKADLQKAREATRRERIRKTTDLRIARLDLRSLLRAEKVDEKAVAAKLAEAQAAQGALLKLRIDSVLAMKKILTPEQQKKMAALRAGQGMNRMGQRMKMRGHRGMQGQGRMGRPMGRGMGRGGEDPDLESDLELDPDMELEGDIHPRS